MLTDLFNHIFFRCLSLGAPTVASPVLSPSTRVSLGMQSRQRQLSYSSQEPNSLESDSNQMSPTHSLSILSNSFDCLQCGRSSPAPDLQTYVTEMTKEIATNIKSEIREVISKVEDALENTDSVCSYYERHGSGSEDGRSDSISANEVKMSICVRMKQYFCNHFFVIGCRVFRKGIHRNGK